MLDYQKLAELLFPHVSALPEDMEAAFPKRELPEGAKVTRFAPSPTGFVHFGGLFPTTVAERLAHQSGGVLYLRIEDTDAKREVPGAAEGLIKTLATYGIEFDEGAVIGDDGCICDKGIYGPYKQSERAHIYHVYDPHGSKTVSESGITAKKKSHVGWKCQYSVRISHIVIISQFYCTMNMILLGMRKNCFYTFRISS